MKLTNYYLMTTKPKELAWVPSLVMMTLSNWIPEKGIIDYLKGLRYIIGVTK